MSSALNPGTWFTGVYSKDFLVEAREHRLEFAQR